MPPSARSAAKQDAHPARRTGTIAMTTDIQGLHHVTAITLTAQVNHDFYARALGLRFVKRTVNFDDPSAWHLYYGDGTGAAGTIMTFFAWEGIRPGRPGAGQVAITQFAIPRGAMGFWTDRLPGFGAARVARETVFGEDRAVFADPEGLLFALVETDDRRAPWTTADVGAEVAIRGFRGVTLALRQGEATAAILTDAFGYAPAGEAALGAGRLIRFALPGSASGVVDLHVDPTLAPGVEGAGSVHHVAFSVPDRAAQLRVRERMQAAGLRVTQQIDRDYFWAIYARTPGGVLFEVATEEPGFVVDEPVEALGTALKLPRQHEPWRAQIEAALPALVA
jgi:glyoxalase family protein